MTKSTIGRVPGGELMGPRKDLDRHDADLLARLKEAGHCQARLLTDRGMHYVYCGGYFHGKTQDTPQGLRCRHHRSKA